MVTQLSKAALKKLEVKTNTPCVSIYLPTIPGFAGLDVNRIAFKNAVQTAKNMCQNKSMNKEIQRSHKWEQHAEQLADDANFWKNQQSGVAIFIDNDKVRTFQMDAAPEKRISVGVHFSFEPLREAGVFATKDYFVLALSQKATRLFESVDGELKETAHQSFPHELKQALRFDELEKELQTHTVKPAGYKHSEALHGHGYVKDVKKQQLHKFARTVAHEVKKILGGSKKTLIVVGSKRLMSEFHAMNDYKPTILADVFGNVDHLDAPHLQQLIMTRE